MNRLGICIFFCYVNILPDNNGFAQSMGVTTDNQKQLIEEQLLKPIRIIHDSAQLFKAFANAYTISSVWKYELESTPSKKNKYYKFVLREYRGAFIIDQYKFRLYEQEAKMEVEDWETGTLIDINAWLKKYKKRKQQ